MTDRRYRLEASTRSDEIASGLQANIADPLWMLARQWQVGEFRGEDASSPIQVSYQMHTAPVDQFQAYTAKKFSAIDHSVPLEAYAEQQSLNQAAGFWRAAEAGMHLLRLIAAVDDGTWRAWLRGEYALALPTEIQANEITWGNLLVRRACDGARIFADRVVVEQKLSGAGTAHQYAFALWLDWYEDRLFSDPAFESWDSERIEYRFSVAAGAGRDQIILDAKEYPGGHLDWFSFDKRIQERDLPKLERQPIKTVTPTPVQFAGMATQRWFEFEDGTVNFADVSASAVDFARMITAAFMTNYGDDWHVIPVRVPIGSLAQIQTITVLDSFGDRHVVKSVAANDGAKRVWRFFELNNDDDDPLLFVPAVALGRLEGRAIETVVLIRDETENLGWGVEKTYEGVLERRIERQQQWAQVRAASEPPPPTTDMWNYRLLNPIPPYWIPFIPVRMADSAQIRLRRGRMSEWESLPPDSIGIHGTTLLPNPAAPLALYEEEIPASGIEVTSSYQFARQVSGQSVVWLGKQKRPATKLTPIHRQTDKIQRKTEK